MCRARDSNLDPLVYDVRAPPTDQSIASNVNLRKINDNIHLICCLTNADQFDIPL